MFQDGFEGWAHSDYWVKIKSSKYNYVKETSNCCDCGAFYECFVKKIPSLPDFGHCPKKCLPSSWASKLITIDSKTSPNGSSKKSKSVKIMLILKTIL